MRLFKIILTAILLSQILVESLFCLYVPETTPYRQTFFASMRLLHIGVIPSFFIFLYVNDYYLKVISLTLIIQGSFRFLLEIIAFDKNLSWIVLGVNKFDYYGFTLIITSTALSLVLNGLLNSNSKLFVYILLLLQKIKCLKK